MRTCRERKKQKAADLQTSVDELSQRMEELAVLRKSRDELQVRHDKLEQLATTQQQQLAAAHATVNAQQRLMGEQAAQLRTQQQRLAQQDAELGTLRDQLGAADPNNASSSAAVSRQLAAALRAMLSDVPPQDANELLSKLPDALLQRIHSCCREVSSHLRKSDLKEQPIGIQVSCC